MTSIGPAPQRPQLPPVGFAAGHSTADPILQADICQLRFACTVGDLAEVEKIVAAWRNPVDPAMLAPDAQENFQDVLAAALENRHAAIVRCLLDQGVPIDVPLGQVAATQALATGSTAFLQILLDYGLVLRNQDIVQWYLENGADPNAACRMGSTPMEAAARFATLQVMEMLIRYGGRVESTDLVANAAIGHAKNGVQGRLEMARYLIGIGAPIDTYWMHNLTGANESGSMLNVSMIVLEGYKTALHIAAESGNCDMVTLLLQHGADRTIRTFGAVPIWDRDYWSRNGKTALKLAEEKGHDRVVAMLQGEFAD